MAGSASLNQNNLTEAANEIASVCQLRSAVLANHLAGVNRVIEDHVNVNMVMLKQLTALHIAARMGHDDIVEALIDAPGVNLNVRGDMVIRRCIKQRIMAWNDRLDC